MTAQSFADLVNGRAVGPGRWQARCPAHDDSSPSLLIKEGQDRRVLVRCWAGCGLDAVLRALHLTASSLFAGPPPSRKQMARLAREREVVAETLRAERGVERVLEDKMRKADALRDAIGAKLARTPDDSPECEALSRLLHQACDIYRKAHTELGARDKARANGPQMKGAA